MSQEKDAVTEYCSFLSRVSNWGNDKILSLQRGCINIDLCYFFSSCSSGVCWCVKPLLFLYLHLHLCFYHILTLKLEIATEPTDPKDQMNFVEVQVGGKKRFLYFPQFALLMQYSEILILLSESWDM